MAILACLFCFHQMTLEEKVGQVLMVHFRGEVANEDAKTLIQETDVGGIIYYNWANGLTSPQQVQELSASLQKLADIPLLIAADQEGGRIARLKSGFTLFPGNKALADTKDPRLAEQVAFATGQEMRAVGVNMNLAPVVDVNTNTRNPIIGTRAFSDSPEIVTTFARAAVDGYHNAGLITTLKHFPGHGAVNVDSHTDLPIIHKSMQELEAVELLPFAKLASGADAIMTAHILVPALDENNCSTLSKKTLSYLRDTIGFNGLIIADSLVMEGVLKQCKTVDEAAIRALNAGCDMLILGGKMLNSDQEKKELTPADVKRIHRSIVRAVKEGMIPEERLNTAVTKILELKRRYLDQTPPIMEVVHCAEHQALAKKIEILSSK